MEKICKMYFLAKNTEFALYVYLNYFDNQVLDQTQCCQWLATAAAFLRKELCCLGAMMRRWAPPTRYMPRRITASIMKDMI